MTQEEKNALIETGKYKDSPFGLIPTKESSLEDLITEFSVNMYHLEYSERWSE